MADLHDLVAPYALDALDPEERARFETHLETCRSCHTELLMLSEAVTTIARSASTTPPKRLKDRVLHATLDPADVTRLQTQRKRFWIASVAAILAVVFLGLWAVLDQRSGESELIAAVLDASDAASLEIDTDRGSAQFTYSPALGLGVFDGGGLESVGESNLYQLWLIGPEGPESAGTLEPGDDEVLVEGVAPGLILAMTVEPEPGGAQPSGTPLFTADL